MAETVKSLQDEVKRLQDEVKRVNTNYAAHLETHAKMIADHDKAMSDERDKYAKEKKQLAESHKKALETKNAEHAAALTKAASEPPEVRAYRERLAKIAADAASAKKEADAKLHAAMKGKK